MRIFKVFEMSREVKKDLTQDDKDDIIDAFIMYVGDKYNLVYKDPQLRGERPDTRIGKYSIRYDEKIFKIEIIRNSEWGKKEFNSNMALLKKRLNALGFVSTGHARAFRYSLSWYNLEVYKPMFSKLSSKF